MKAAELMVKALEAEGVERIFAVPGEENLDLIDALRTSTIELILCRHEQAAGFMAATWGRLTGKAGVCLATLGPGATNLVTAAAFATLGAMPVVMITGQKPIKTSKQGEFQIIDVIDILEPVTKYTKQIVSAEYIPSQVREAFRIAEEERPGATHLELPEDIAADSTNAHILPLSMTRRPIAEDKAISHAIKMIESAKHPLLLIGAGANRKLTSKMLTRLVNELGIPFVTTQMGKGVVDEMSDLFLGCTALSQDDFVHRAIEKADLLINAGHDVVEKPPFLMKEDGFEVIHINFIPAKMDPVYFPQAEVIGDIANSIWRLVSTITPQKHWDFKCFKEVKSVLDEHILRNTQADDFPMLPERVVHDVAKAVGEEAVLSLDNGLYKIWFARNFKSRRHNSMLLDNALASMGAGLPGAMAACIAQPKRNVLAICGDGGFMMNSQEMETAVRLKLNLVILLLRDNAYGMIRWKQQSMGMKDYGLEFGNPDFVLYAQAYGAKGYRLTSANELVPKIQLGFESGGVHLIEVPIDYGDSYQVLLKDAAEQSKRI
ncbi:MAG: acetolactate synthase-1/2/3 large subunit [Kiritimatiellia bacterium]